MYKTDALSRIVIDPIVIRPTMGDGRSHVVQNGWIEAAFKPCYATHEKIRSKTELQESLALHSQIFSIDQHGEPQSMHEMKEERSAALQEGPSQDIAIKEVE